MEQDVYFRVKYDNRTNKLRGYSNRIGPGISVKFFSFVKGSKVKAGEMPTRPKSARSATTRDTFIWFSNWVNEKIPYICFSGRISTRFRYLKVRLM